MNPAVLDYLRGIQGRQNKRRSNKSVIQDFEHEIVFEKVVVRVDDYASPQDILEQGVPLTREETRFVKELQWSMEVPHRYKMIVLQECLNGRQAQDANRHLERGLVFPFGKAVIVDTFSHYFADSPLEIHLYPALTLAKWIRIVEKGEPLKKEEIHEVLASAKTIRAEELVDVLEWKPGGSFARYVLPRTVNHAEWKLLWGLMAQEGLISTPRKNRAVQELADSWANSEGDLFLAQRATNITSYLTMFTGLEKDEDESSAYLRSSIPKQENDYKLLVKAQMEIKEAKARALLALKEVNPCALGWEDLVPEIPILPRRRSLEEVLEDYCQYVVFAEDTPRPVRYLPTGPTP